MPFLGLQRQKLRFHKLLWNPNCGTSVGFQLRASGSGVPGSRLGRMWFLGMLRYSTFIARSPKE